VEFFPEGKEISILSMSKGGTGMILSGGTGTGTFSISGSQGIEAYIKPR